MKLDSFPRDNTAELSQLFFSASDFLPSVDSSDSEEPRQKSFWPEYLHTSAVPPAKEISFHWSVNPDDSNAPTIPPSKHSIRQRVFSKDPCKLI